MAARAGALLTDEEEVRKKVELGPNSDSMNLRGKDNSILALTTKEVKKPLEILEMQVPETTVGVILEPWALAINLEAQKDEIMVMESILGVEQFTVYEGTILSGRILIELNISEDFEIYDDEDDRLEKHQSIQIKHLPPLILHFTLPVNYPSSEKPVFTLSSVWLDRQSLSKLCSKLDVIWNANVGTEILYQWSSFLKEHSMQFLSIDKVYNTDACMKAVRSRSRKVQLSECDSPITNNEVVKDGEEVAQLSNSSSFDYGMAKCAEELAGVDTTGSMSPDNCIAKSSEGEAGTLSSVCLDMETTKDPQDVPWTNGSSGSSVGNGNGLSEQETAGPSSSSSYSPIKTTTAQYDVTEVVEPSGKRRRKRRCSKVGPSKNCDQRAVFDTRGSPLEPGSVMKYLTEYDYDEQERTFSRMTHSCGICLTDKLGSDFLRLKCTHAFCKECIQAGYTTHIKEGAVENIKCLAHLCTEVPSTAQVRSSVGEELFQRYDSILLKRALETMGDLIYCPRGQCMKPVIRDPNDTLALCSCGYKFCCVCKMVYHGVEPCRFKSEIRKKLFEEYTTATKDEKIILEKTYGAKQIRAIVDTTLSEQWLEKQSKPCPHCKVPIEKFEGCNKVTCWKCNSFFCWICLRQLDLANPYHHFNDPTSTCYSNLFENVNDNDEEEFEDEDEDDPDSDESSEVDLLDIQADIEQMRREGRITDFQARLLEYFR